MATTKCPHVPVSLAQNPKMGWAFKLAGKLLDNYMIQIGTIYHEAEGERDLYDPMGNVSGDPLPPVIKPEVLRWPVGHAREGTPVIIRGYAQAMQFIADGKSAALEAEYTAKQAAFDEQLQRRALESTQKFTGADIAGVLSQVLAGAQNQDEPRRGPGRPRNEVTAGG